MANSDNHKIENDIERTTIAILGGGGFIGTYLVLNLLQLGAKLHLLVHKKDPDFVSARGQIDTFQGSIEDEEALVRCFSGCDYVYHLVGIIAETRDKTFAGTMIEGTRRVVAAARKCGVKRIIYQSALGVTEDAESAYMQAKYASEQAIINSGIGFTIFRPSIVYGVQDNFINKIADMVKLSPLVPVIGDGKYRFQPVYVEELCALLAYAWQKDFTIGKTYEIGGPEKLTYLEIIDIIKRVLRVKRGTIHVPVSFARMAAAILEKIFKPAPLTVDQIKMMKVGSTCDHSVVEKEFGVTFTPLELQLQKYLER